ncbi:MAG: cupin domain-containing protein [Paracoccaceae bacterium]
MSLDLTGFDTGARLRAERQARGLSQRQLAQAAGVTSAMISMVEQNRTSPSVATLKKMLAGLGMSLGAFFAEGEETPARWHFPAGDLREISPPGATGGISLRQVGGQGASAIQMLHERYAPGAGTGAEPYAHEGEEAGLVIAGRIRITVGGETRLLAAGDAYLFSSRLPHRFENPGPDDCMIVSACTPPTF